MEFSLLPLLFRIPKIGKDNPSFCYKSLQNGQTRIVEVNGPHG